jgi:hypothetical protein
MSKAQSNIIYLAAQATKIPNLMFDEIIHQKRAEDLFFKSSLFETINIIKDNELLDQVSLEDRFSLGNLFHWLNKKKNVKKDKISDLFARFVKNYVIDSSDEREKIEGLLKLFKPTNEEDSFSITVFPGLKEHLNVYDLVEIVRGLDNFFNLIIQSHFSDNSPYSIFRLNEFIKRFQDKFEEEVKSKSEMSFMMSSDNSGVVLSATELYRAFLNSAIPVFFTDLNLPDVLRNHINLRLIVETNINIVGEVLERTFSKLMNVKSIRKKIDSYNDLLKNGTEDEIDNATQKFKDLITSLIDRLELEIHVNQYNNRLRLNRDNVINDLINEQLEIYNKEPHYTVYSLNKLFEFKPNQVFTKLELVFYIKEMNETTYLLRNDPINVPDEEMRFFVDRMIKNTMNMESFGDLLRTFRGALNTPERNQTLHALLQECTMNNRHASALLSFYYAAKIENQFGNKISLLNIEEIANRLGSTYSVTRRFKIAKFLEDSLSEGKIKGQPLELLQNAGYFSLIMHKVINQKELEYAFDQYINIRNVYDDFDESVPRTEHIKRLVNEIEKTIQNKIKENFQSIFDETENSKDAHEITRFAETKIITLLTRELDSRRRENTVKDVTRAEMEEFINQFAEDAFGQYEAERETQKINIADLYMQIQHYSMRVSVVLGDVRQKYNSNVEDIRNLDNYSDIEKVPIILGGIAVAHREKMLNFEERGLFKIIEDIRKDSKSYKKVIYESIDKKHGNIEVKNEMGKTRPIYHDEFSSTNAIIKGFEEPKLGEVFINVILIDLLKEISDALVSSRNMAKNSVELKTALDDIFNRSGELLEFAETEYNRIMGIKEEE